MDSTTLSPEKLDFATVTHNNDSGVAFKLLRKKALQELIDHTELETEE